MEKEYYMIIGGRQAGPFAKSRLLDNGLTPETLVWTGGMSDWTPASQVPDLADLLSPSRGPEAPEWRRPGDVPPRSGQYTNDRGSRWFAMLNGVQTGPMSLQELRDRGMHADTPVWTNGMADWLPARQVPEVIDFLSSRPYGTSSYGFQQGYPPRDNRQAFGSERPFDWKPWAIAAAIVGAFVSCLGLITGIFGYVYAKKAGDLYRYGDWREGDQANSTAKTLVIITIVIDVLGIIGTIGFATGIVSNPLNGLTGFAI